MKENQASLSITPGNTVFAFDLHGVVLQIRLIPMFNYLWHELPFGRFLLFFLNPTMWPYIIKFFNRKVITEQEFNKMVLRAPYMEPFRKIFIKISTLHSLNHTTVTIMQHLKDQGYHLYILSNIWLPALEALFIRFSVLKELFNGFYIPSETNGGLYKPERSFYQKFKQYIYEKEQTEKQIVFFDNVPENVKVARNSGILAYSSSDLETFVSAMQQK